MYGPKIQHYLSIHVSRSENFLNKQVINTTERCRRKCTGSSENRNKGPSRTPFFLAGIYWESASTYVVPSPTRRICRSHSDQHSCPSSDVCNRLAPGEQATPHGVAFNFLFPIRFQQVGDPLRRITRWAGRGDEGSAEQGEVRAPRPSADMSRPVRMPESTKS